MTIRQRFTKVIDTPEEAIQFGEESALIAYSFMTGFGDHEIESDDNDS